MCVCVFVLFEKVKTDIYREMPFFSHNSNDLLLLFSFPVVIVVVAMLTFRVKVKVEKQFSMQTLSVVLTLKAKMPSVGSMNVYLIFIPIL